MPKYFEYDDPDMAAHVDKMVGAALDAVENETIVRDCQVRPKEYAINNRTKPFSPMTKGDVEHRYTLGTGGGKDHFVVAKHREEQKQFVEEYESMASDRDANGNFHMSTAQTAKVAKIAMAEKVKEEQSMGFLQRIKKAITFSKAARMQKEEDREIKAALEKAIEEGDKL